MLGYNTYYDLSPLTGGPLTEELDPALYSKLMAIQKKISNELDASLAKHNIKLNEYEEDLSNNMV